MSLFRTKPIDVNADTGLKRCLGAFDLTMLGIGCIIGTGIFVLTGVVAAQHSGPAIVLSFILSGIACAFAALCYAELAGAIGGAGSAYGYAYSGIGELVAWIIGWDLILEYAFSNMAVSVGFAGHAVALLDWFGIHPNLRWISPAYLPSGLQDLQGHDLYASGWHFGFNIPAFLIVMLLTMVLVRGIRESAETNNVMVLLKIAAILLFIGVGAHYIHPTNWKPFYPNGWSGVLTGGSIIFFTYIGFDSVSTAAEECKNPQRDVPIGIIATLIICTILYIGVAVVLTSLIKWTALVDDAAPVVNTLKKIYLANPSGTLNWTRLAIIIGAMLGMISSILVFQIGQARVWFAMSRDRLLPSVFAKVHPRFRTPSVATWVAGFVVGVPAGLLDIGTFSDLSNIGTLFAFVLVSAGVLILRYKDPNRRRGFRCPGGPILPILSIAFCALLMAGLPIITWIRFFIWLGIGLLIYFFYSRKRSEFAGVK